MTTPSDDFGAFLANLQKGLPAKVTAPVIRQQTYEVINCLKVMIHFLGEDGQPQRPYETQYRLIKKAVGGKHLVYETADVETYLSHTKRLGGHFETLEIKLGVPKTWNMKTKLKLPQAD